MNIVEIIAQLNAAKAAMPTIIGEAIDETKDQYVAGIKKQLLDGYDGRGERLTPSYRSRKYALAKNQKNPIPGLGNPDLNLTGAWFAGMDAVVEGQNLHTGSTDSKDLDLQKKYGPDIERLGGDYNDEYVQTDLLPVVREKLTELTNLKF